MKIVVIGGTGLIGAKVVKRLRNKGHEVMAASPDLGVNTLTGEGLAGSRPPAAAARSISAKPAVVNGDPSSMTKAKRQSGGVDARWATKSRVVFLYLIASGPLKVHRSKYGASDAPTPQLHLLRCVPRCGPVPLPRRYPWLKVFSASTVARFRVPLDLPRLPFLNRCAPHVGSLLLDRSNNCSAPI
jgi:hypothetical protein